MSLTKDDIKQIRTVVQEENDKFAIIMGKSFDGVQESFNTIYKKFDEHDKRFEKIENKLVEHDNRFNELDNKLDDKFDYLNQKMDQNHQETINCLKTIRTTEHKDTTAIWADLSKLDKRVTKLEKAPV